MRPNLTVIKLVSMLLACAGSWSCGATCDTSDEGNDPVAYNDGVTTNGYYASSSPHGNLLHFPAGARYDLYHHLGFEPIQVQMFWAFSKDGIETYKQTEKKGTLSPAAGNSALIQLLNDQFIRVKNDSCVEYWLLVIASGDLRPANDAGDSTVPDASTLASNPTARAIESTYGVRLSQ